MLHTESLPYAPGSDTSREAAETGRTNAAKWRAKVAAMFAFVDGDGYTADELAGWFNVPANTIAPRITSLQQAGEIIDSGKRRLTRSGKRAVVWVSAPPMSQRQTYVVTFYVRGVGESLRVNALTHTLAIQQAKQLAAAHGIDVGAAKKITAEVAK